MTTSQPIRMQAALAGKRVLITGCTGFLAKVVLEKLIRSVPDVGKLVLLVRADRSGNDARKRFDREIATSSIFEKLRAEQPHFLAHFFAEKIECVTGEVSEPRFGLTAEGFQELANRVDVIINSAASVNFREALDEALSINALSIHNITALARMADAPLIQVSTCYVNGFNQGDMLEQVVTPVGTEATIERHPKGYFDVAPMLKRMQQKIDDVKTSTTNAKLRERLLTDLGIAEANHFGWNDTYTLTKWMGEQFAMEGMQGRTMTIVRPSIIESTLQEPVPGWIEGVKVADAIIVAYARGKTTLFPAKPDEVIDIVPADLVANSILMATAEALIDPGQHRIYQACTGSANPILLGNVIDLFQTEMQTNWQKYDRLLYSQPKHQFRVVSRTLFLLMLSAMGIGVTVWGALRRLIGIKGESPAMDALRTTQTLAQTFSFYTTPSYRFHNSSLMQLAQRFDSTDKAGFSVDARLIDWPEYLCHIHMAGLNQFAMRKRRAAPAAAAPAEMTLGGEAAIQSRAV
ncbi:MAG: SDR family oxidoreductase [Burkholderiales bacterium]|nr:SDR family oxidoreductase [Burkholderiales bacterium]